MDLSQLILQCNRCRHKWLRRTRRLPRQCPLCKTQYWNKPRVMRRKRQFRAAIRG